jgi:hypothetical protein
MKKFIKPGLIMVLALAVLALSFAAQAQTSQTYTVQGGATVEGNNYALAKTIGLTDAYKKALTLALTDKLGEKTVSEKSKLIEDHFFSDPSKFVNRYRILTEQFVGDAYTVNAEVDLSLDKIQIELVQAGLDRTKNQSVVLVVFEQDNNTYKSAWLSSKPEQSYPEKIMALEIQSWGYRMVRPEPAFDPAKLEKNIADKSWLMSAGEKYNAEFMVEGVEKLVVEKKEPGPADKAAPRTAEESPAGTYIATCQIEVRLLNLSSGEKTEFQKTGQSAEDSELAEAKNKATELALRSILPDLSLAMERTNRKGAVAADKGPSAVIEIEGVKSYYVYKQLLDGLKKTEGLGGVGLWGFGPDKVMVTVKYSGDPDDLKNIVSGRQYSDFRLLPIESEKSGMRFRLETISK